MSAAAELQPARSKPVDFPPSRIGQRMRVGELMRCGYSFDAALAHVYGSCIALARYLGIATSCIGEWRADGVPRARRDQVALSLGVASHLVPVYITKYDVALDRAVAAIRAGMPFLEAISRHQACRVIARHLGMGSVHSVWHWVAYGAIPRRHQSAIAQLCRLRPDQVGPISAGRRRGRGALNETGEQRAARAARGRAMWADPTHRAKASAGIKAAAQHIRGLRIRAARSAVRDEHGRFVSKGAQISCHLF